MPYKNEHTENRRKFFLTFFNDEEGYEEKNVNGWWLIKHRDADRDLWTVHLYSNESYRNYKNRSV